MQPYYELAYALASESLCLFVGTGFSKHITAGEAPDWQSLLVKCCEVLENSDSIISDLFPEGKSILPLEECASVIALQMKKEGKNLHAVIAIEIKKLKANDKLIKPVQSFAKKHRSLKFITTNYDRLIEDDVLDGKYSALAPGFPVTRQRRHQEVYHIHGAVAAPSEMVVTSDDYYRFMNNQSYFSKKLDTLIQENTTVIIGYSLGDINFKSILNAQRQLGSKAVNRQHLFFLSRKKVPQHIKDYYDASYGLRVIENTSIDDFINKIDSVFDKISAEVKDARIMLRSVLDKEKTYSDDFLRKEDSFAGILATISSTGFRVQHKNVIKLIADTIDRKHNFTKEDGAWQQYVHLASWLVQIGCVMDLQDARLSEVYLKAVGTSFSTMSKEKVMGKSWDAYRVWKECWGNITYKNRDLIRSHMKKVSGDHLDFVRV